MVEATGFLSVARRLTWNGHDDGRDHAFVLEVVDLHHGVVPIAADQRPLRAEAGQSQLHIGRG